jgi:hypothetical protein
VGKAGARIVIIEKDIMARIENLLLALANQGVVFDEGDLPYDIGEWGVKEAQKLYELIAPPTKTADLTWPDTKLPPVNLWNAPKE